MSCFDKESALGLPPLQIRLVESVGNLPLETAVQLPREFALSLLRRRRRVAVPVAVNDLAALVIAEPE